MSIVWGETKNELQMVHPHMHEGLFGSDRGRILGPNEIGLRTYRRMCSLTSRSDNGSPTILHDPIGHWGDSVLLSSPEIYRYEEELTLASLKHLLESWGENSPEERKSGLPPEFKAGYIGSTLITIQQVMIYRNGVHVSYDCSNRKLSTVIQVNYSAFADQAGELDRFRYAYCPSGATRGRDIICRRNQNAAIFWGIASKALFG